MKTGISLYCSTPREKNRAILQKARAAGVSLAFTSLQIPEEDPQQKKQAARAMISDCREYGIRLMLDIAADTAALLGCHAVEELEQWGITHIRLDDGFTPAQTAELSHTFHIVGNASTIGQKDMNQWQKLRADMTRFSACHNYYPKPWTGLSLPQVQAINRQLHAYGLETMAFVPGDAELRGPLHEGLPTIENHREERNHVLKNALELYSAADCDIVLQGDPDMSDAAWEQWKALAGNELLLEIDLPQEFEYLYGTVHHDRPDASEYVFRSVESRRVCALAGLPPTVPKPRPAGSICLSNDAFLRYRGELEITRKDLPPDARVTVIGRLTPQQLALLQKLPPFMAVRFVPKKNNSSSKI